MAVPFSDAIKSQYYQGWNDQASMEQDWANTQGSKLGSSGSSGGGGGDTSGIDMSQVPSVQDYQNTNLFPQEDAARQDVLTAMSAREKPLDIYTRLEGEAGLPQLRQTSTSLSKEIANIEDYLGQIEPDVTARTRESLVTEAQRRGMVASARTPFLEKLEKFTTGLGRIRQSISDAMADIGNKVGYAMQGQEMDIDTLKFNYSAIVDRGARQLSAFTTDRQTLLESLYDKLNRQRTLDDREYAQMNALKSEESQYLKSLQTAAAEAGYKVTGGESADQLLGIIGTKAAEEIAYSRKKASSSGGTATERAKTSALTQLRSDIANGGTFEDLVRRYGDVLDIYQIRSEYDMGSRYGPAKESEQKVQEWSLKPKVNGTSSPE